MVVFVLVVSFFAACTQEAEEGIPFSVKLQLAVYNFETALLREAEAQGRIKTVGYELKIERASVCYDNNKDGRCSPDEWQEVKMVDSQGKGAFRVNDLGGEVSVSIFGERRNKEPLVLVRETLVRRRASVTERCKGDSIPMIDAYGNPYEIILPICLTGGIIEPLGN
ncbi:MAG TPA: hypothetical protein PL066_03690 [bacterium]|nr:hypothetical protein [bacterium]